MFTEDEWHDSNTADPVVRAAVPASRFFNAERRFCFAGMVVY